MRDFVNMAGEVIKGKQATISSHGKNPYAVELGRRGYLKGGKARAENLSIARRVEIAKKAALARWGSK